MDTELIKPFDILPARRHPEDSRLISAVLFATGELVEVGPTDVLGLVLTGYEGLNFGDDGTMTARVASELPLQKWDGVNTLTPLINDAVRAVNPAYCAEYVGGFSFDEASVLLRAGIKQANGIHVPDGELFWPGGSLSIQQAE